MERSCRGLHRGTRRESCLEVSPCVVLVTYEVIMELRPGEVLISQCAGGNCIVCKHRIEPGIAIQLSKWSNRIRHVDCVPKTDGRCFNRSSRFRKLHKKPYNL